MRKISISFLILFGLCAGAYAQDASPQATPKPSDPGDVVRISTNLIQLDFSVVDAAGKTVPDLKPDEVEIYENGRRQGITSITYISGARKGIGAAAAQTSTVVSFGPARRTIALIVDNLSLSAESSANTRRALKKFVAEQMQSGDLAAIVSTAGGVNNLQRFTTDKAVLNNAIDEIKFQGNASGEEGSLAPIKPTDLEKGLAMGNDLMIAVTGQDLADERNRNRSAADYRAAIYAAGTLGSLKTIVAGMGSLEGRKSAILFSDGFKLVDRNEQGLTESGRISDLLRQLVDQAARSAVTVYTIDARGQQTDGLGAQDSVVVTKPRTTVHVAGALDPVQEDLADRRNDIQDRQAGLEQLARQTGGFATKNSNDLSYGVGKVLEDQGYYLLSYSPDAETFDSKTRKFNNLEVKISRPGATARYRSGFFNVPIGEAPATNPASLVQAANSALVTPFGSNAIGVTVNASVINSELTGTTLLRGTIHIAASDLTFVSNPDGSKKSVFELIAATFDQYGVQADHIAKSNTINVSGAKYDKILAQGFDYPFELPIKKPGTYQFRVMIRDTVSARSGTAIQILTVPGPK
ncbi:MAG: VWA domain-containing protein [Acidobacteriota bacterium]